MSHGSGMVIATVYYTEQNTASLRFRAIDSASVQVVASRHIFIEHDDPGGLPQLGVLDTNLVKKPKFMNSKKSYFI